MVTVKRFTASWCAPCKQLGPIMSDVAKSHTDVLFEVIDIEADTEQTLFYNIRSVPTVIIFRNEREVRRFVGVQTRAVYTDAIAAAV